MKDSPKRGNNDALIGRSTKFFSLIFILPLSFLSTTATATEINTDHVLAKRATPVKDPLPKCHFASDSVIYSKNLNISKEINMRCLNLYKSIKFKSIGKDYFNINSQKCGVLNATSLDAAANSELCFRSITDKIKTSLVHNVAIPDEKYLSDYKFPNQPKFKTLKESIDINYNKICVTNKILALGFERAVLTEITQGKPNGIVAKVIVQFSKVTTNSTFDAEFKAVTTNGDLGSVKINGSLSSYGTLVKCPEINTLFGEIPKEIKDASNVVNTTKAEAGTTIDFKCPADKKLSDDSDKFDDDDDVLQILCDSIGRYTKPSKWPTCVKPCPRDKNKAPAHTGLKAVKPPNTIPAGKSGQYECDNPDTEITVDQGESRYFDVKCNEDGKYNYPKHDTHWPVCGQKTTTPNPLIKKAISSILDRYTDSINYRYKVYRKAEGDEDFVPTKPKQYFQTITIPSVICLIIFILSCLCCTRNDSPLCSICNDTGDKKERVLLPIEDE